MGMALARRRDSARYIPLTASTRCFQAAFFSLSQGTWKANGGVKWTVGRGRLLPMRFYFTLEARRAATDGIC